jgi:UDP-glucose 4-epimerase
VEANADGTKRLAIAAAEAGVQRFVHVSTVKVNGEETPGIPYSPHDIPQPKDVYGTSKWLAERYLHEVSVATGLQAVIVRPPLVYGPGVKANFLRLMQWVRAGRPLPFGSIRNVRSLVSVWNLSDLLVNVLRNASAPGKVWLVSDGEDVSTPELVRRIAVAMNRRVRLLSVPPPALRLLGTLTGKHEEVGRLCGSLAVDIDATRRELGWSPPMSVDESLSRTVQWYLANEIGG